MRVWVTIAVLVALAAPRAQADPASPHVFDWCSGVVVRPDQFLRAGSCDPVWSPQEIARGAEVVLLGDFRDVSEPVLPPFQDRCGRIESHAANARRVAALRRLREPTGLPPLEIVHYQRFELVPRTFAALPGFDARFLLETRRPWQEVLDFFQRDRSAPCLSGGCRWSDSNFGDEAGEHGTRLRDLIDASGGPGAYRRKVYYVIKSAPGQQIFFPVAALGDLRNADYRAWRVAEAKRAMAVGGYTAIALVNKFHQYGAEKGHWIGSGRVSDVASLDRVPDTLFSAAPSDYGYAAYVAGWAALARDLRAAGVPYAVEIQSPEFFARADDPSTAADEGALIREAARGASLVLLDRWRITTDASLRAATADLEAHGARVVPVKAECGYGRSAVR